MDQQTKQFPLRVLLTVTTGRLLTKRKDRHDNGIGDLYELLGWMTGESPFTHQFGRFGEECKPWLLRWFPELAAVNADVDAHCDQLNGLEREARDPFIDLLVERLEKKLGKSSYDVPRIPADDHEHKHPFDELVAMRGTDEGIITA